MRSTNTLSVLLRTVGDVFSAEALHANSASCSFHAFFVSSAKAGEFYWQKVKTTGRSPAPRWHHTVAVRPPSTLVLFGGFRSSSLRFNDLWLLDTKGDKWSQPPPGMTEEAEDGEDTLCFTIGRCNGSKFRCGLVNGLPQVDCLAVTRGL